MAVQAALTLPLGCTAQLTRTTSVRITSFGRPGRNSRKPAFIRWHLRQITQPAVQHRHCAGRCAAAADGGGGDGTNGSGGSGGGGDEGDAVPGDAGGWDARRLWTLFYALAVIGGGVYAYVKKGSRPSLIASSAVGACLLGAVWEMGVYQQAGIGIALATSAVLAMAMGNRYRKSRKFMPSGMLALVSALSAWWYASWPA